MDHAVHRVLRMRALASFASALAVVAAALCTSGVARADDDAPPPSSPAHTTETQWYGWQTLLVDAGTLGLAAAASQANGGVSAAVGIGGYALGGPLVHALHGRGDVAGIDIAVRVGAPLVAGAIGYGVGVATFQGCAPQEWFCGRDWSGIGGAAVGVLVGGLGAVIFDAAALGRERVRHADDDSVTAAAPSRPSVTWSPQVAVSPRGEPSVGVGGAF